jgi:hypothetical protein
MELSFGAFLALLLLAAVFMLWRKNPLLGEGYCPGPSNITLYDAPYKGYPTYEGRGATWWDGDRRCAAYCQQSPCVVWCR